jgi:hypothetical protein
MISHTSFKDMNSLSVHGNPDDTLMTTGNACMTKCRSDGKQASTFVFNLQAAGILYIGQTYRYSPENAFYIFSQQIYVINFLDLLAQSPFISLFIH